jgi:hypothetical protein
MKKYKVNLTTDEGELIDTWDIQIFSNTENEEFLKHLTDEDVDNSLDITIVSESELYRERGPFLLFETLAEDIQSELQKHFKEEE